MSRADTPSGRMRAFPEADAASGNARAEEAFRRDTEQLPPQAVAREAADDESQPAAPDQVAGCGPDPAARALAEDGANADPPGDDPAENEESAAPDEVSDDETAEDEPDPTPAAWSWLRDIVVQAALAGTTPHVPAPTTTTYGTPTGLPSPARQREQRRRARHGHARHGLLGRSFAERASRSERRARRRAFDRAALAGPKITARGVAPVVARGVARVPRPGESPPPRTVRAVPRPRRRQRVPLGALAVVMLLVGVFATGLGLHHLTGARLPELFTVKERQPGGQQADALPPSPPTKITIPALELQANVHTVGLTIDGEIEVPPMERHHEAGWFNRSPTPGELGPAIIVGHVDSRSGPSVFHGLKKLRRGDTIEITRQDGSEVVFVVDSVERFNKRALPNDRVYGDYSSPNLRLITCGGQWVGGNTGYEDNVIVFASLLSTNYPR